jgi:hypothetical protein
MHCTYHTPVCCIHTQCTLEQCIDCAWAARLREVGKREVIKLRRNQLLLSKHKELACNS